MSPVLGEQRREVAPSATSSEAASDRLHFLLVRFLYASKENERL
jgi:hypothetical protein